MPVVPRSKTLARANGQRWVRVFSLLALGLSGCGDDGDDGAGAEAEPPPPEPETGCMRIMTVAAEPECLVQWNCSDDTAYLLLCMSAADGTECLCSLNGESAPRMLAPDGCGSEPFERAAEAVCGWSFE